nr:phage tail protein [Mitsuokella multacida]
MANWTGGMLTAAGRALQLKVEAGTKLELTKIKLGDGTENIDSIDTLTDLVGPKASLGISSVTVADNLCTVTAIILTSNLSAGFYAREWGLFAKDGDKEILYMISLDPNPDYVPPSTAALKVSATYAMNIAVSNAANIACTIDPSGLVNTDMLTRAVGLVQRNTAYQKGDILYDTQLLRHDWHLECTTAGTTGSTLLDLSSVALGSTVTDGTVVWTVKRMATQDEIYFELDSNGDIMPKA